MPWSKTNLPENVLSISKKEEWTDAQIARFVDTANGVLSESGDEGEAIATGIKAARSVSNALDESERVPPESAQNNARKVLKWREEHGDEVQGMTQVGWTRANQLADGGALSEDVIKRMAQFARHEKNAEVAEEYKSTPWKDAGYVAWLGWGGTSGINWAKGLSEKMKKENAKQEPKVFYARHMVQGVARYEDEDVLVRNDAIKAMCKSFEGKPVFVLHQETDLENIQQQADGFVSDCFYCEEDGWFWLKFVAVSDGAHDAIARGWSVSNAYYPVFSEQGGTWLNVPYNREVIGGDFDHLAIVDNPRYEGAVIMNPDDFKGYKSNKRGELEALKNAKDEPKSEKVKSMFDIFKREKVAVTNSDDLKDAFVSFDGAPKEGVSMSDLVDAFKNAKNEAEEEDKKANKCYNMDDEVEVDGNMVKIKDLVNAYMKKKNAEDEAEEEAKKEAEKEAEDKANEEEERKKNAKEEAEEGKAHLDNLKKAIENGKSEQPASVITLQDKVNRGREAY